MRTKLGSGLGMTSAAPTLLLLLCGAAGSTAIIRGAAARSFTVDQAQSHATIDVGKSGVLSFAAGHTHEVLAPVIAGAITVDPANPSRSTVRVQIDASALKVTGKGESAGDVPKVQQAMASDQVLNVRRYPTIVFESRAVAVKGAPGATLGLIITGDLTLHGVARPLSVPVSVRIDESTLTATGHFSLKQTDYGIKPVSVGGVVSVKDTVEISFTIVGR